MNNCPTCSALLKLLQLPFKDAGIAAPSDRTGEIRGCQTCNTAYYFGATRADQSEHWMLCPYKFTEFSRSKEDWNQIWNDPAFNDKK
jgi:hypothetical protein